MDAVGGVAVPGEVAGLDAGEAGGFHLLAGVGEGVEVGFLPGGGDMGGGDFGGGDASAQYDSVTRLLRLPDWALVQLW